MSNLPKNTQISAWGSSCSFFGLCLTPKSHQNLQTSTEESIQSIKVNLHGQQGQVVEAGRSCGPDQEHQSTSEAIKTSCPSGCTSDPTSCSVHECQSGAWPEAVCCVQCRVRLNSAMIRSTDAFMSADLDSLLITKNGDEGVEA